MNDSYLMPSEQAGCSPVYQSGEKNAEPEARIEAEDRVGMQIRTSGKQLGNAAEHLRRPP